MEGEEETPFLLRDERGVGGRVLFFSTVALLARLSVQNAVWIADGTFSRAPNFFAQIYTIFVVVLSSHPPYSALLDTIKVGWVMGGNCPKWVFVSFRFVYSRRSDIQ